MKYLTRAVVSVLALTQVACTANLARNSSAPQGTATVVTGSLRPAVSPQNVNAVRVGLLAPLSGPNRALGQALLNAATLATYETADAQLEILPFDTAGNPQQAVQAAIAAAQSGVQAILGPLTAAEVQAVKPTTSLPILAFSTDTSLADAHTYLVGFPVENQVARVLDYAWGHNLAPVTVVAPPDAYGDVVARAADSFKNAHAAANITIVRSQPDVAAVAQAIATTNPRLVLLADSGAGLIALLGSLGATGEIPPRVTYAGTGLWDDPAVQKLPALRGALYPSSDPAHRQSFVTRYQNAFGVAPPRLASLGYDAAALAAVLVRAQTGGNVFNRAALTNPNGFSGVDGIFRLGPDGVIQRGLAILEITPAGPRVIDAAPASFQAGNS